MILLDADFNNDGRWNHQDWADYQSVYSEGPCSTGNCDSIDSNGDGSLYDPTDIETFYRTWARLPLNEQGWTALTVDASATDVYVDPDATDGDGRSMHSPIAEASSGRLLGLVGYPTDDEFRADDIRRSAVVAFRRGTVHPRLYIEFGGVDSGRPLIITSYGDPSLPRPVVRGITVGGGCRGHVLIVDLDIAAPEEGSLDSGVAFNGGQVDVLLEGNRIAGWRNNIAAGGLRDSVIRRNVIVDAWSPGEGHSQGLGPSDCDGLVVAENVIDRNGWAGKPGRRTKFNHGIYNTATARNVVVSENLISRNSNTGLQNRARGQHAFNNLFIDNPANLTFGHAETPPALVPDGRAIGNVIVGTVRGEGWMAGTGLGLNVCKGLEVLNTTIVGLPDGAQPNIRIEPAPASWGTRVSTFTVSNVQTQNTRADEVYRTLGPDEKIIGRTAVESAWAGVDVDAFIDNARQSRKGDWRLTLKPGTQAKP